MRLQGAEREQLGVYTLLEALDMAKRDATDLLLLNESEKPPICRSGRGPGGGLHAWCVWGGGWGVGLHACMVCVCVGGVGLHALSGGGGLCVGGMGGWGGGLGAGSAPPFPTLAMAWRGVPPPSHM